MDGMGQSRMGDGHLQTEFMDPLQRHLGRHLVYSLSLIGIDAEICFCSFRPRLHELICIMESEN